MRNLTEKEYNKILEKNPLNYYQSDEPLILIENHEEIILKYLEHKSFLKLIKDLKLYKRRFIFFLVHMYYHKHLFTNRGYAKAKNFFDFSEFMEYEIQFLYKKESDFLKLVQEDISFVNEFMKIFKTVTYLKAEEEFFNDNKSQKIEHWVMDGRFIEFEFNK